MQKHWSKTKGKFIQNKKLDEFLDDLAKLCDNYGYCIEHEDHQGGFIISRGTDHSWIMAAMDNTQKKKEEKK